MESKKASFVAYMSAILLHTELRSTVHLFQNRWLVFTHSWLFLLICDCEVVLTLGLRDADFFNNDRSDHFSLIVIIIIIIIMIHQVCLDVLWLLLERQQWNFFFHINVIFGRILNKFTLFLFIWGYTPEDDSVATSSSVCVAWLTPLLLEEPTRQQRSGWV
ncbi:hypothetical protein F7725_019761 [Dissostichus mawsoni]|uniref:Uncharacterized protein n=1 Tax=Dissostichus mawsoni TaxID=36200 RepID=A0A7J5YKM1_DISMA|nr:hypothetical protein F7725_019761 [Dissostichus mawsoni]